MTSKSLKNLILAWFSSQTAYEQHKNDSDLINALKLVKKTPIRFWQSSDGLSGYRIWEDGFTIMWGVVVYSNSPDGQLIPTPLEFSDYFGGSIHDIGMSWTSGGSYASLDYVNGRVMFRPLYAGIPYNNNTQAAAYNGVKLRWLIFVHT